MATDPQLLKHALSSNNNDFIVAQRRLKDALDIPEESPAFIFYYYK